MDRVNRIWYLSPMRAAKVQASLRIRAVSPEPSLLAHTSSESKGTFRQKARSLAPLNAWACAVKICHDGLLEDTNSLDGAHMSVRKYYSKTIVILKLSISTASSAYSRNHTHINETSWYMNMIISVHLHIQIKIANMKCMIKYSKTSDLNFFQKTEFMIAKHQIPLTNLINAYKNCNILTDGFLNWRKTTKCFLTTNAMVQAWTSLCFRTRPLQMIFSSCFFKAS